MVQFSEGQSARGPFRILLASRDRAARESLFSAFAKDFTAVAIASLDDAKTLHLDSFDAAIIDEPLACEENFCLPLEMVKHLSAHRVYVRTHDPASSREYYDVRGWRNVPLDPEPTALVSVLKTCIAHGYRCISKERNRPAFTQDFDRRHRLLVVDDEDNQCVALRALFSPKLDVSTATSVASALAAYDLDTFDVAIIDWHLPGESGMQLARELRRYTPQNRIILYTADDAAAQLAGASFRVVSKSTDPETLEREIYDSLVDIKPRRVCLGEVVQRSAQRDDARATENEKPTVKPRMLVADTGQEEREMLSALCGPYFDVTVISNAQEAEHLALDTYDIAVVGRHRDYDFLYALSDDMLRHLSKERVFVYSDVEELYMDNDHMCFDTSTEPEFLLFRFRGAMDDHAGASESYFNFPSWAEQRERRKAAPRDAGPKLLVVDDEMSQCIALKAVFSSRVPVVTATSVDEVTREHDLAEFSAAIIDWHLPGESGIVLARLLGKHMPPSCIFLYTADDKAADYATGSFQYVSKSIEPEVLEKMVLSAIERSLKKGHRFA